MAEAVNPGPLALVLSGGGARGAYEIGVLRYALGSLLPRLPESARPRIFCGTSVGAINACALAANCDLADLGLARVAQRWLELRLEDVFRLGWGDLAGLVRWMLGRVVPGGPQSVLDASPLAALVRAVIPWRGLHQAVAQRRVLGVSVTSTDVESGQAVVFLETSEPCGLASGDRNTQWTQTRLTPQHALASAAIPFVFPTVEVAGRVYTDGSLRQNTPIAPALRLGAGRVLVIGLRTGARVHPAAEGRQDEGARRAVSSPLYLSGKLLDALLLDRVENDLANLRQVNAALRVLQQSGPHLLGPGAVRDALEAAGGSLRPVSDFFVRPSVDLGKLAAEVLQTRAVRARLNGPAGYLLRQLGEVQQGQEPSDLVSYLLFDGDYAAELMSIGEADARAQSPALEAFLLGAAA